MPLPDRPRRLGSPNNSFIAYYANKLAEFIHTLQTCIPTTTIVLTTAVYYFALYTRCTILLTYSLWPGKMEWYWAVKPFLAMLPSDRKLTHTVLLLVFTVGGATLPQNLKSKVKPELLSK